MGTALMPADCGRRRCTSWSARCAEPGRCRRWAGMPAQLAGIDAAGRDGHRRSRRAALGGGCDVAIDFTAPQRRRSAMRRPAPRAGCALVVGTTGLRAAELAALACGRRGSIPVLLCAQHEPRRQRADRARRAQAAALLGPSFDIEIIEAHHRHKKDAPPARRCSWVRRSPPRAGSTLADVAV